MIINFEKQVRGSLDLSGFFSHEDRPHYSSAHKCLIKQISEYKFERINRHFVAELGAVFDQLGFQSVQLSFNRLYVCPPGFQLEMASSSPPSYAFNIPLKDLKLVGKAAHKRLFRTLQLDLFEEIPTISLNGEIKYENLNPRNPKEVLDVLVRLGYSSRLRTTAEQLIKAKAREVRLQEKEIESRVSRAVRSEFNSRERRRKSEDDLTFGEWSC